MIITKPKNLLASALFPSVIAASSKPGLIPGFLIIHQHQQHHLSRALASLPSSSSTSSSSSSSLYCPTQKISGQVIILPSTRALTTQAAAKRHQDDDSEEKGSSFSYEPLRIGPEIRASWPELHESQWSQLEELANLLVELNARINVISRKDIQNVIPNHIVPALGIAKLLSHVPSGTKVLDIGTGGGFPGLPLAIACPKLNLLLVDSVGKKIRSVQEMADALGLYNVETRHARIEDLGGRFDYVVGRSVTAIPRFLHWAKPKLRIPKVAPTKQIDGDEKVDNSSNGSALRKLAAPAPGILYISGLTAAPRDEEEEEEFDEPPEPEKIYDISDLLSIYEGDKVVMHFNALDVLAMGGRGDRYVERIKSQYDEGGVFRPRNEGVDMAVERNRDKLRGYVSSRTRGERFDDEEREADGWRGGGEGGGRRGYDDDSFDRGGVGGGRGGYRGEGRGDSGGRRGGEGRDSSLYRGGGRGRTAAGNGRFPSSSSFSPRASRGRGTGEVGRRERYDDGEVGDGEEQIGWDSGDRDAWRGGGGRERRSSFQRFAGEGSFRGGSEGGGGDGGGRRGGRGGGGRSSSSFRGGGGGSRGGRGGSWGRGGGGNSRGGGSFRGGGRQGGRGGSR